MADAEIGRVLAALDASGERDNTIVIMTSDHGEGRGRHHMVLKNYLYDEASRVPLVVSWPGRIGAGRQDKAHLVSGTDIVPTLCDYAGVKTPAGVVGRTLRPLLEGKRTEWRELVVAEVAGGGRMIRTAGHKYVAYPDDPVEQLFDMQGDAGETKNLAPESAHASALESHRKLLKDWTARLEVAPQESRKRRKGCLRRRPIGLRHYTDDGCKVELSSTRFDSASAFTFRMLSSLMFRSRESGPAGRRFPAPAPGSP